MTTYLKDLTQSIGRYGGLSCQNWFKGCLEAQVVSLLSAKKISFIRTCDREEIKVKDCRIKVFITSGNIK